MSKHHSSHHGVTFLWLIATVLALATLSSGGCGKSPTGPTACNDPAAINNGQSGATCKYPAELPGTTVRSIDLPGTDKKMLVWIVGLNPAKNSQLTVGQQAVVTWKCSGPAGYWAWISLFFIEEGMPGPSLYETGPGLGMNFFDCGGTTGAILPVTGATNTVRAFRFNIWVEKGMSHFIGNPASRPADFVHEETLNWQAPK